MNTGIRFHIHVIILAACGLLIPLRSLAISATRVAEIDQFMTELKQNKIKKNKTIKNRAEMLKRGLTTRELNSLKIEQLNDAVAAAMTKTKVTASIKETKPKEKINNE